MKIRDNFAEDRSRDLWGRMGIVPTGSQADCGDDTVIWGGERNWDSPER